jgi:hypothetical protein
MSARAPRRPMAAEQIRSDGAGSERYQTLALVTSSSVTYARHSKEPRSRGAGAPLLSSSGEAQS